MNLLDTEEPIERGNRWAALEAITTSVAAVTYLVGRRFKNSNSDVVEHTDVHSPTLTTFNADPRVLESDRDSEQAVNKEARPNGIISDGSVPLQILLRGTPDVTGGAIPADN